MVDQFDGDLALILTLDGGEVCYTGGQPLMDLGGLETAVNISLFTQPGWWGNGLEINEPDNQIGSIFEETCQPHAITIQRLNLIEQEARNALLWLINLNAAKEITVSASSPELNRVDVDILITRPDETIFRNIYQLNWIAGYLRPVTAEVRNA